MKARILILFFSILMLFGCKTFEEPYTDFSVGKMDEKTEQSNAVILIGDPQVINRETLINDRIRELNHIDNIIRKSSEAVFAPQLRRDISVIRTLAMELGISFNPSLGDAFSKNEDIESVKTELELFKLRNELEQLQKLADFNPGDTKLEPSDEKPGVPSDIDKPSIVEIQVELKAAIDKINVALVKLIGDDNQQARESQIESSPEEKFEDLDAYRVRLRQRESEVRLDDVHDANGNNLYRLQFNVTVLPGKKKNKYGVLDIEILSPQGIDDILEGTYDFWLTELMKTQLIDLKNRTYKNRLAWERAQSKLISDGMVKRIIIKAYQPPNPGGKNESMELVFFVNPKDYPIIFGTLFGDPVGKELILVNAAYGKISEAELTKVDIQEALKREALAFASAFRSLSAIDSFLSAIDAMEEIDPGVKSEIGIDKLKEKIIEAANYTKYVLQEAGSEWPEPNSAPDAFISKFNSQGKAYCYQAQPTIRVQRISSVASAANSIQMAMSLAATIPNSGIGAKVGAAAGKSAVGMADAIERSPVVIGYTDRGKPLPSDDDVVVSPRFGYVFGPKAILVPGENKLEYKHIPASYPIYADISVPGWWPWLTLKVRRAWAGNWHNANTILKQDLGTTAIEVHLPSQQQIDGDMITNFLVNNDLFTRRARDRATIMDVTPKSISACAGEIKFLIKGKNLWRNPRAYLRGKRHQSLEVLPDMQGIVVMFNMKDLPIVPFASEAREQLTVWTSYGEANTEVSIVNQANGIPCGVESGSVTGLLTSRRTRYVHESKNKSFRVDLTRPMPKAFRDVKVMTKLVDLDGTAVVKKELGLSIYAPNDYFEADGQVVPPLGYAHSKLAGASLYLGLSYKTTDYSLRDQITLDRPLIYYPTIEQANFKMKTKEVLDLTSEVIIKLPEKFNQAYPGFVKSLDAFTVKVVNHPKVIVLTRADWNKYNDKVVLKLTQGGISADDLAGFRKAWCGNDLNLTVENTMSAGSDKPTGISGSLILKKNAAGCL